MSESGASKASKGNGNSGLCLDRNGVAITGGDGKPLKVGRVCDWVLASLDGNAPCRSKDGYVLYDELGRPLRDDKFCPDARILIDKY